MHDDYYPHPVPLSEQQRIMRDLATSRITAIREDDRIRSYYLRDLNIED